MKKLVLIDAYSILNRAFYGLPALSNSKGIHTNGVYGFLNIMFKILDEEGADYLAVAFDVHAPTFRHLEYEDYKGTRKPMPEELTAQVPLMKEVLKSMHIPILEMAGYEADDILGTVAKRWASEELEVSVVSGDRDLLQLADTHIKIRIPKTIKGQTVIKDYYPEDVLEEYGVSPLAFIEVKALMGDASDNIPGVPGIGEKTATAIIREYGSIENAYAKAEQIKPPRASKALLEYYDKAVFSKFLATIKLDVPLTLTLEDMAVGEMENEESFALISSLEFKSLMKRFDLNRISVKNAPDFQYIYIDNVQAAKKLLERCKDAELMGIEPIYAYCPQPFGEEMAESVGALSLCFATGQSCLLCLGEQENAEYLQHFLKGRKAVYSFNVKGMLKYAGCDFQPSFRDLGIAAYLINPLKDSYKAEDIARDYLDISFLSEEALLGKKDLLTEIKAGNEQARRYAAGLSHIALQAWANLEKNMRDLDLLPLYTEIEMPLCFSLAKMEMAGIGIDGEKLAAYSEELVEGIAALEKEIHEDCGERFNINSPKQLGEILFEKLGLPGGKKTKTGYSTAADILEKLAPDYPQVRKILEYRLLSKLNSTYAQGLRAYIGSDGRIHGKFNQTIAATGRISSTEPNLQNIPIRSGIGARIRDVFVPKEGCVFIDADYSQIELRVLASMAEDEKLIESYRSGKDIHAITASQVFNVPLEKVDAALRRNAKAVNFGVVYGISAFGLSEDLSISRKEALDYINNYFKTYPKVKAFLDRQVKEAKEKGFVRTMYGRIRPIPEIKSSNFMQRAFGDRVAMNSPIQGTAADIMKLAMIGVDKALEDSGYEARIVLQVHDELLVEAKREDALAVKALVEKAMGSAARLAVELAVDAHIGETWLQAKE